MLIRFTVENFLSFRDKEVFSLLPGKGRLHSQHKTTAVKGISVLKTAVIYGANASGKSNLIKSIEFGKKLVLKARSAGEPVSYDFFKLDENKRNENSKIEYEIQHKNKNYAYGFVFNTKEIVEEWLFEITKQSETKIFERTSSVIFNIDYLKNKNTKNEMQFLAFTAKGTPRNQLFLSQIRNTNVTENVSDISDILNVIDWFQNALTVIYPDSKSTGTKFELSDNSKLQKQFTEMLAYFDTGIDGIEFKETAFEKIDIPEEVKNDIKKDLLGAHSEKTIAFLSNPQNDQYYIITKNANHELEVKMLKTKHKIIGKSSYELFDLKDESDGTRRIMDLIPLTIDFFKGGNVFIIDELERSLHPNLIYDLFDYLLSECENINSQLIVASHESTLLTQKLLRKDEIWFTVKDKDGISHLHSLEEYNIRFDKEVRRDYLFGRYKGIPKLGNRNQLSILSSKQ